MEEEFIKIAIAENLDEINIKDLTGLCFFLANNIKHDLEIMDIDVSMWNIKDLLNIDYDHYFLISNNILIDPTYIQFLPKEDEEPIKLEDFPARILEETDKGREFLGDLLNNGYHVLNDDIDLYLGSFKVKERRKYK